MISEDEIAGGLLVSQIMDWPLWLSVCSLMALASFFAIAGGLEAIAVTNVFQMGLLILASGALVVAGIYELGAWIQVINATAEKKAPLPGSGPGA